MCDKRAWSVILIILSISKADSNSNTSCYWQKCFGNCRYILPKIDETYKPKGGTIYFIQTSCAGGLDAREACAVESAARANPRTPVVALFTGPLRGEYIEGTTKTLHSYANIHLYRIDLAQYALNTPFEDLFNKKVWEESPNATTHVLDFLRILTLYKYGGIYLDLDMIVAKSFDRLPKNFVSRIDSKTIGTGVIGLSRIDHIGRRFALEAVNNLASNYNPRSYSNSVAAFTRTMRNICETDVIRKMNSKTCLGFFVLQPEFFYPVHRSLWQHYFKSGRQQPVWQTHLSEWMTPPSKETENNAYTHHLWNSLSSNTNIEFGTHSVQLAGKYCPKTFKIFGDVFGKY